MVDAQNVHNVLLDPIQQSVGSAAGAESPGQLTAQRLADPPRLAGQFPEGEFDNSGQHAGR
jgi:hypothetical protein